VKVTRHELKSILKECIRELIDEGAFDSVLSENFGAPGPVVAQGAPGFQQGAGQMVAPALMISGLHQYPSSGQVQQWGPPGSMSPNDRLKSLAAASAAAATPPGADRRLWESAFLDTALREEAGLYSEQPGPLPSETAAIQTLAPPGGARRWAEIAFARR
jgi:hypothetical protein